MIAVENITSSDINKFINFHNTHKHTPQHLLLSELPSPHTIIAVTKNINIDNVLSFCKNNAFNFKVVDGHTVLISKNTESINKNISFSGYIFNTNKIVFGANEFYKSGLYECNFDNMYGEYAAIKVDYDSIYLYSDYFGMSSFTYYNNDKIFAASNSYHFLLLLLKFCGEHLKINIRKSRVNLITTGFEFGSAFTRDMDVDNCKINFPYETIIFRNNKVDIQNSDLYNILNSSEEWNEDIYESYLDKGKQQIIKNIESIFTHSKFEKIIIDLSGGFDSRVVFAASNLLPKAQRNKILIFSRKSHIEDDLKKAELIINLYGYKRYNYIEKDCNDVQLQNGLNLAHISRNLGSFSQYTIYRSSEFNNKNQIELMGGIGDAILGYRRISGWHKFTEKSDVEILDQIGRPYFYRSVKQLENVYNDKLEDILTTLNEFENFDLFKKLHILYILSRNRFHFASSRNIINNNQYILPLQSKDILKAKWMYFNTFKNNNIPDEKVAIDLINKLNPILSMISFAKENDNVIPPLEKLLQPIYLDKIDKYIRTTHDNIFTDNINQGDSYVSKVKIFMQQINIVQEMLSYIYKYSNEYIYVCAALYKFFDSYKKIMKKLTVRWYLTGLGKYMIYTFKF